MPHGKQVSPDKGVNFRCTTASFTVSPVPWALTCCAALPGDSALYDISVRRPTSLPLASFRPCLTATPLLLASHSCKKFYIGTLTGDLNPISSRPCRAYTKKCSRPHSSAADLQRLALRGRVFIMLLKSLVVSLLMGAPWGRPLKGCLSRTKTIPIQEKKKDKGQVFD